MTGSTTEAAILAAVFLIVSAGSAAIQGVSLWRLTRLRPTGSQRRVHTGMLRTSICRVVAAVSYVVIGVATLLTSQSLPVLALVVFCGVQVMWQVNAYADLRLRRSLNTLAPAPGPDEKAVRRDGAA